MTSGEPMLPTYRPYKESTQECSDSFLNKFETSRYGIISESQTKPNLDNVQSVRISSESDRQLADLSPVTQDEIKQITR